MAKLTDEEQSLLKRLTAKAKAPDETPPGRMLNFTIDLANDAAVERAKKLGIFPNDDPPEDPPGDDPPGDDPPGDDPPKRKGFFGE